MCLAAVSHIKFRCTADLYPSPAEISTRTLDDGGQPTCQDRPKYLRQLVIGSARDRSRGNGIPACPAERTNNSCLAVYPCVSWFAG